MMRRIIGSIIILVPLLQISGCGPANVDQAALTFPHTVGILPPLQLVLVANGPDLRYRVVCLSNGQYQSVNVEFHTANSDGGSARGGPIESLPTCTPGTIVIEDMPLPTMKMNVGDTIEITFSMIAPNGREQKITRSYVKGEDGALHSSD
jgi:hypothetical protein